MDCRSVIFLVLSIIAAAQTANPNGRFHHAFRNGTRDKLRLPPPPISDMEHPPGTYLDAVKAPNNHASLNSKNRPSSSESERENTWYAEKDQLEEPTISNERLSVEDDNLSWTTPEGHDVSVNYLAKRTGFSIVGNERHRLQVPARPKLSSVASETSREDEYSVEHETGKDSDRKYVYARKNEAGQADNSQLGEQDASGRMGEDDGLYESADAAVTRGSSSRRDLDNIPVYDSYDYEQEIIEAPTTTTRAPPTWFQTMLAAQYAKKLQEERIKSLMPPPTAGSGANKGSDLLEAMLKQRQSLPLAGRSGLSTTGVHSSASAGHQEHEKGKAPALPSTSSGHSEAAQSSKLLDLLKAHALSKQGEQHKSSSGGSTQQQHHQLPPGQHTEQHPSPSPTPKPEGLGLSAQQMQQLMSAFLKMQEQKKPEHPQASSPQQKQETQGASQQQLQLLSSLLKNQQQSKQQPSHDSSHQQPQQKQEQPQANSQQQLLASLLKLQQQKQQPSQAPPPQQQQPNLQQLLQLYSATQQPKPTQPTMSMEQQMQLLQLLSSAQSKQPSQPESSSLQMLQMLSNLQAKPSQGPSLPPAPHAAAAPPGPPHPSPPAPHPAPYPQVPQYPSPPTSYQQPPRAMPPYQPVQYPQSYPAPPQPHPQQPYYNPAPPQVPQQMHQPYPPHYNPQQRAPHAPHPPQPQNAYAMPPQPQPAYPLAQQPPASYSPHPAQPLPPSHTMPPQPHGPAPAYPPPQHYPAPTQPSPYGPVPPAMPPPPAPGQYAPLPPSPPQVSPSPTELPPTEDPSSSSETTPPPDLSDIEPIPSSLMDLFGSAGYSPEDTDHDGDDDRRRK